MNKTGVLNGFLVLIFILLPVLARLVLKQSRDEKPYHYYDPVEFDFATAKGNHSLFAYDLGGTVCACDRTWSITDYWEKMFTGFAFNFPHLIDAYLGAFVLPDQPMLLTTIILANEVVEELFLAISGRWGFSMDPPYDLESRWDAMIRDVFCCLSAMFLGRRICLVLQGQSWVRFPLDWSDWDSTNPHSIARGLKTLIVVVSLWQSVLIYNADRGIGYFNRNNLVLIPIIIAMTALVYCFNIKDFLAWGMPRRRIIAQHVAMATGTVFALAFSVYPFWAAMYLILMLEVVMELVITLIEILIKKDIGGINAKLGIDYEGAEVPPQTIAMSDIRPDQEQGQDVKPKSAESIQSTVPKLRSMMLKVLKDFPEDEPIDVQDVLAKVTELSKGSTQESSTKSTTKESITWYISIAIRLVISVAVIIFCVTQPLQYDGPIYYTRHWCGNPRAQKDRINTCVDL